MFMVCNELFDIVLSVFSLPYIMQGNAKLGKNFLMGKKSFDGEEKLYIFAPNIYTPRL
jgi:hypothetical protein